MKKIITIPSVEHKTVYECEICQKEIQSEEIMETIGIRIKLVDGVAIHPNKDNEDEEIYFHYLCLAEKYGKKKSIPTS